MKKFIISLLIILVLGIRIDYAQWSNNPSQNNRISFNAAESAVPYVATHPCGTTYISWFASGFGGNYFPWIQKIDVSGYPQWDSPLQVSSNASLTWISDYSLAVTPDTCALIAFQDMRTGFNDVFIYKIGQNGTFLWGNDGVQLSDNPDEEYNPVMAVHPDGSVVVAWPRFINNGDSKVVVQRLNSAGQKTWANDLVLGESGYDYTWPRVVPVENGNTIIVFYKEWGPYWAPNRIIYAQKIDSQGNSLWPLQPSLFNGIIPVYIHPQVAPDGDGGVYVCWMYEKVMSHLSSFVQHVSNNGIVTMAANGVEVSTNMSTLALEPAIGCDVSANSAYIFWRETDLNQNVYGLFGQRMDINGNRKWGNNGLQIEPVGSQNAILPAVTPLQGGAIVGYEYDFMGSADRQMIKACRLDSSGNKVWTDGTITVSSAQSGKGYLASGPKYNSQIIYAWSDDRLSGTEIFAQNLCENGSFGLIDDSFEVNPDTLFFLTDQEIFNGKMFHIINPHDYSLDIQYIQQQGPIHPGLIPWFTEPWNISFPVNIAEGDSLGITVKWPLIDRYDMVTMIYDTLKINTVNFSGQVIIAVDSLKIVMGINETENWSFKAFPNPFNDLLSIDLNMDSNTDAVIEVFDVLMKPVRNLYNSCLHKGFNHLIWDGTDKNHNPLAPGVYLVSIRTASGQQTFRVIKL